MARQLASLKRVLAVSPIEGADAIEAAQIEGWTCVVKKGEFQVGDLGVFFEIDARPPAHPVFEFLWAPRPKQAVGSDGTPLTYPDGAPVYEPVPVGVPRPSNFRIKTKRLRGVLSQGLFMPLSVIKDVVGSITWDEYVWRLDRYNRLLSGATLPGDTGDTSVPCDTGDTADLCDTCPDAMTEKTVPTAAGDALPAACEAEDEAVYQPGYAGALMVYNLAGEYVDIAPMKVSDVFDALRFSAWQPVSVYPVIFSIGLDEGMDLTTVLGVEKWEPPLPSDRRPGQGGVSRSTFPPVLPKTDETRLQSVQSVLDELEGKPYVVTLKIDGTSATYLIDPRDGAFHACSRNQSVAEDSDNDYWRIARAYGIPEILAAHADYAIQGEIYGPGWQKNPLGKTGIEFAAFNVYSFSRGRYLDYDDAARFLRDNGIPAVPVIERGDAFAHSLQSLLALAKGKYAGTKNHREGLVVRSATDTYSQRLKGRLSFKVINNDFLLREAEH